MMNIYTQDGDFFMLSDPHHVYICLYHIHDDVIITDEISRHFNTK